MLIFYLSSWDKDRFMSHDIEKATRIVKSGIVSISTYSESNSYLMISFRFGK
jgi:hypothetical protein